MHDLGGGDRYRHRRCLTGGRRTNCDPVREPQWTSRECTSLAEACNLSHVLATATAPSDNGDAVTVMVAPGTYYESSIAIDASSLASLTVKGAGASACSLARVWPAPS